MAKSKLLKNWIVVNSKSHPDRVYYFNTRTSQSSWTKPTASNFKEVAKNLKSYRTQQRSVKDSKSDSRPVTPDNDNTEENNSSSNRSASRKSQLLVAEKTKEEKETPQMIAIREKIAKKKEQQLASKRKKSLTVLPESRSNKSLPADQSPTSSNVTATVAEEKLTPQMKVIYEKIQQRNSTGSPSKVTKRRLTTTTISLEKKQRPLESKAEESRLHCSQDSFTNVKRRQTSSLPLTSAKKPQDAYQNVETRLTRLGNKLIRNKIRLNKTTNKQINIAGDSAPCSSITTLISDAVRQSATNCEEMEWEPMEDEEITVKVQAVRNQLYTDRNPNLTIEVPTQTLACPVPPTHKEKQQLYIVVDTNVFLSNINAIELAREATFVTYDRPIIVVPWTVIRELDYIKDSKGNTTLSHKARSAVDYLNKLFASKQRIIGQKSEDVEKNKEKFEVDCPDDEILQTCLQIRDLGKSVVLLSYDKNLCTKAMIYDITALGRNDPLEKVDYLNVSNQVTSIAQNQDSAQLGSMRLNRAVSEDIFDAIKLVMKDFLAEIVKQEMSELYGGFWEKHVLIPPPWTTITVFKCAIKHWIAATSESFSRRAESVLTELLKIFIDYPNGGRNVNDVSYVLEKSRDLVQMANTHKHSKLMVQTAEKLDELREKLSEYDVTANEQKLKDKIGVEDNSTERQRRADKAFRFFEAAYAYARDMCGLASDLVGMPCSIPHEKPNPVPSADFVRQAQPELAVNVNKLLHILSIILEQPNRIDHQALFQLHRTLVSFIPQYSPVCDADLTPLDLLCCVQEKEQVLKTGIHQLQELSTHFCRLASFRCT